MRNVSRPLAFLLFASFTLFPSATWAQTFIETFRETPPAPELARGHDEYPLTAWVHSVLGPEIPYAPNDVADIGMGIPHPAQKLTIFYPVAEPRPGDRFPAILYCQASRFFSGETAPDPAQPPGFAFLTEAAGRGWAVVTVGTTGVDSCPVGSQPGVCENLGMSDTCPTEGPDPTPPCRDSNLWFEPSTSPASPWNDFFYFYGEKDFVWARQFIAEYSGPAYVGTIDEVFIDNTKIVASGVSTGAHYSAFTAYRATPWPDDGTIAPIGSLSSQVQQSTRVAGVAAFEPVGWIPAWGTQGAPPPLNIRGHHWQLDGGIPFDAATWASEASLEDRRRGSTSRWLREPALTDDERIPMFMACGDGLQFSAGFGRNGNDNGGADYDRNSMSSPPFDPLFEEVDTPAPLWLHDPWQPLNIIRDLTEFSVHSTFHQEFSRLYLRDDLIWANFPTFSTVFSLSGSTPDPVADPDASDLPLVDGFYTSDCGKDEFGVPITVCDSVRNFSISERAVDWSELVSTVSLRNAGTNPDVYRVDRGGVLGETLRFKIDASAYPEYTRAIAFLILYDTNSAAPFEPIEFFAPDRWLLSDILTTDPEVKIFQKDTGSGGLMGGPYEFEYTFQFVPQFVDTGVIVTTQICLYDGVGGAVADPALSNAIDIQLLRPERYVGQDVWINEIHYDNMGMDIDEGVEIAGPGHTNLTGLSLHYYAADGVEYGSMKLNFIIQPQVVWEDPGAYYFASFGTHHFKPGLSGGVPIDLHEGTAAIALYDTTTDTVIQFLSYGGVVTATNGPASGSTSTNIGAAESESTPVGHSLQLGGSGNTVADFTWGAAPSTRGDINTAQVFTEP